MMQEIYHKMNEYGAQRVPFFFLINFELDEACVHRLDELPSYLDFSFFNKKNKTNQAQLDFTLTSEPLEKHIFKKAFDRVKEEIEYGNSFLLNLTFPTKININLSLEEIFTHANAKYKILWKGRFTCFSPETFVTIKDRSIHSFPMKGTIDANLPNAEKIILADEKEAAEHFTIVDLIRNDLAQVGTAVDVKKFRYIDALKTNHKDLLQVSSEIVGTLKENWREEIGSIIEKLLPAGSISGAPKKKTIEIIQANELDRRGFYTGVAGVFDGASLDSCVMIRFIEQMKEGLVYRSGGGITFQSDMESEYQELLNKIYVPIF